MKRLVFFVFALLLGSSLVAYAQRGMGGGSMGQGGMRQGKGMGQGSMDKSGMGQGHMQQMPMSQSDMNSGAFQMLQQRTAMSSSDLHKLYASSGTHNFGQFASAMLVSKNLGLDYNKVLTGMKNKSLVQTLQSMGVDHDTAKMEMKKAQRNIKTANKR
jgi:hypothetical protein